MSIPEIFTGIPKTGTTPMNAIHETIAAHEVGFDIPARLACARLIFRRLA